MKPLYSMRSPGKIFFSQLGSPPRIFRVHRRPFNLQRKLAQCAHYSVALLVADSYGSVCTRMTAQQAW